MGAYNVAASIQTYGDYIPGPLEKRYMGAYPGHYGNNNIIMYVHI